MEVWYIPFFILLAKLNTVGSISTIRLDFLKDLAEFIMKDSPIRYVSEAKLRGSLFDPGNNSGLVSSVDTGFWVDHSEPLEALSWIRDTVEWPLGDLMDGHEFLLVAQTKKRLSQSRSRFIS